MKKNYRFFKGFLSGWAFMLLIGAAALAMRTKIQGSASENTDGEAAVTQEHVNKLAELEMMIDAYNLEEADKKKDDRLYV